MTQSRTSSMLFLAAILSAFGGSVWAMVAHGCNSCERASDLVSGLNLGLIGALFYGALFLVSLWGSGLLSRRAAEGTPASPRAFGVGPWVAVAAGVHAALVLFLVRNRIVCPPCLFTAASVWVAAAILLFAGNRRAVVAGLAVVSAAAGYFVVRGLKPPDEFWKHRAAIKIAQKVRQEKGTPATGQATLTAYMRPGCHRCDQFEKVVLPLLRKEFPKELAVELRPAPNNINTPTVIILGAKDTIFDSLHSTEDVLAATRAALGRPTEGQLISTGIEFKETRFNE